VKIERLLIDLLSRFALRIIFAVIASRRIHPKLIALDPGIILEDPNSRLLFHFLSVFRLGDMREDVFPIVLPFASAGGSEKKGLKSLREALQN
jgi:hypothetical protein